MADIDSIIEGLTILRGYLTEDDERDCQAEHDEIFAPGPPSESLTPEHAARLTVLGWNYRRSVESWHTFT